MSHQDSRKPRDPSDREVEAKISRLRNDIKAWALKHDIWYDSGFDDYLSRTGREPGNLPVLSCLWSDSGLIQILQGAGSPELEAEFSNILQDHDCWYECQDHVTANIYPNEKSDHSIFSSYFHWQWVCSLVKEDIGDAYAELYAHFSKRPEDLYRLHWRDYEKILAEIFKMKGFDVELGPGVGDGGIDITLIQRDPIGDILTVVQAKKYATHNKISGTEVQALYGVQVADGAQNAMFVTTSEYAPVAKRFAARENVCMDLATSEHVAQWAKHASQGIIVDKTLLLTRQNVSKLIQDIGGRRDPRVVRASAGYNCIMNEFALVVKESKHAALLMKLSGKVVSGGQYGVGREVPDLDPSLPLFNSQGVVRAQRKQEDNEVTYWDGYNYYSAWDGKPCHFDWND